MVFEKVTPGRYEGPEAVSRLIVECNGPLKGMLGSAENGQGQRIVSTLVAHVVFGVTMGLLIRQFLTDDDRDWLIPFVFRRTPGAAQ